MGPHPVTEPAFHVTRSVVCFRPSPLSFSLSPRMSFPVLFCACVRLSRAVPLCRNMEDFVTWVDNSKIREKVLRYNDRLDDYDLFGV